MTKKRASVGAWRLSGYGRAMSSNSGDEDVFKPEKLIPIHELDQSNFISDLESTAKEINDYAKTDLIEIEGEIKGKATEISHGHDVQSNYLDLTKSLQGAIRQLKAFEAELIETQEAVEELQPNGTEHLAHIESIKAGVAKIRDSVNSLTEQTKKLIQQNPILKELVQKKPPTAQELDTSDASTTSFSSQPSPQGNRFWRRV